MVSRTDILAAETKSDFADLSISVASGMAFTFVALFLCVLPLSGEFSGGRDFVAYWATGQQIAHHTDPYDRDAIMRIERTAGLPVQDGALLMRNPPWALPLTIPLGFLGLRVGAILWALSLLACLIVSVRILWRMHGSPRGCLPWLGVSFGPALLCLMMGQTSLFALLGYVLFLSLHRSRPFLAGMSLWLCALKPHLFLVFGVVLLTWVIVSRSYRILAGMAATMAASCAATTCIDRAAWGNYVHMMRTTGAGTEHVPCLSVVLRLWLSPQTIALSYLPAALGCLWALGHFWHRRHTWDWMKDGNPVMLVSLLTAPYSWVYDDALALPSLLHGAYSTSARSLLTILAFASLLFMIEMGFGIKMTSQYYLWTAPAWLVWYMVAGITARGSLISQPLEQ
jgi:hypothetical protein